MCIRDSKSTARVMSFGVLVFMLCSFIVPHISGHGVDDVTNQLQEKIQHLEDTVLSLMTMGNTGFIVKIMQTNN